MLLKIVVVILTFSAALLRAFEKIIKKEKNISLFEYIMFFVLLATAGFTSYQIWDENDKASENTTMKRQQDISDRDTLKLRIQGGIDSGVNANNETLAKAFSKQHIDFDSLKVAMNEIKNDTNKKTIVNVPEIVPDLDFSIDSGISYIGKKGHLYEFRIAFSCREAKARNIEIKLYTVFKPLNGQYWKVKDYDHFADGNTDISKDVELKSDLGFYAPISDSLECLFIVAKGKFWNSNLSKSYPLYSIRRYEMARRLYTDMAPGNYPGVLPYLEPR